MEECKEKLQHLENEEILSQGAEAILYKVTINNQPMIIKHRFPKSYRDAELDKTLNKDENGGTLVVSKTNYYESLKISGVASLSGFVLVKCVTKQKTDVFNVLKTFNNTIDFFECNGEQINFVCKQSDWESVKKVFVRNKIKFQTKFDLSKLTIAGAGFSTHEGAVLKILQLFEENDINFEHFYVSETAIYVILETEKQEKAVSVLIEIFNNKE